MAGLQSAPSSPIQIFSKRNGSGIVTEPPKFDLESYIQNYKGRTRSNRLIHIGVFSAFLGVDALKLAVREAKAGKDIPRYIDAQTHLETIGPNEPEAVRDNAWIEQTERQNEAETQRLEAELKGYKSNLIKESIRMGNEDLGKHYEAIGDLPHAFEAFGRMRQDNTVEKHSVDVSKHLIEVAVEQKNWIAVTSNILKLKSVMNSGLEDLAPQPYIVASQALAQFDVGNYADAALTFLQCEAGMGQSCATIISPNDVAIYGGLCALATMDRNELQKKVLENSHFRSYLELEPQIRHAISFFINSRYTNCLRVLESYHADYLLDIYLQQHINDLYQMIRSKCIVQYFIPFSSCTLASLNEAFAAPGNAMDKELILMITRGELNARINTVDGLLEARKTNPRDEIQREALRVADEYEKEATTRIFHTQVTMAGLEVKPVKHRSGGFSSTPYTSFDADMSGSGLN
ncbi:26S proteasome subunit RPN7-domain-containing protein [Amylocarpus encephaloides]|uniref:COP9 signalosome complex subunit 1 n=1 Tax=Amylocarpus encephaloides TaxID=45428 RepID=A0A9P7YEJ4_9HELO|nr:26S proteasome subunit RPN7-domain-containing protein [Amylocarpus encephaloides]